MNTNTIIAVSDVLENVINPMLDSHGGFAECLKVEDNIAYIVFSGGCQGCAGAKVTLGRYIASAIKEAVPEILDVIDVTDHEAGTDPYYIEEPTDD